MKRISHNAGNKAFTLIEVLVATFILLIMVLILSKVFHQASVAWSAGFRRADGNMTGRSAVGFMAREMMNSCAENEIFDCTEQGFWNEAMSVTFITLAGEPDEYGRVARQITYKHTLGSLSLNRIEKRSDPNNYGAWQDYKEWCLVTNVQSVFFYTPGGTNYSNGKMPAWVRMKLTLNRSDDVSGVGAASAGPDGVSGNSDDVKSW